jgi:hypothetical protein
MIPAAASWCERVYDCTGPCGRRVYEEMGEVYAASKTCEECHDELERGIFPSQMKLVGLRCPVHGWQIAPHLRQAPLFR